MTRPRQIPIAPALYLCTSVMIFCFASHWSHVDAVPTMYSQKGAGNVLLNYISSMSIPGKLREMALKRRFVVFPPDATLLELAYELSVSLSLPLSL
jgi:hypothetical protein